MNLFRRTVEELFNGQVHRRSRFGCDLSILRPFRHDLFVRAPDVFAGGPVRTLAHFGENGFPIKVPKEFVNKSRARNVSLTGSIHIVFVRGFMEGNVIVSRMMVEPREMLPCFARHSECVLS